MAHRVTLIPGDGIGPELAEATTRVLDATGIGFEWERVEAGEAAIASHGTPLPDEVTESIRETRIGLKGPITTPVGSGFRSVNVGLRQALDLYANVRPARSMVGVESRYTDVDLVIVRENTEGEYEQVGGGVHAGTDGEVALQTAVFTRRGTERTKPSRSSCAIASRTGVRLMPKSCARRRSSRRTSARCR